MPVINSQVKNAKPVLIASLKSEDSLVTADVKKDIVSIQRGQKTGILRVITSEVTALKNLFAELEEHLKSNGVDTEASLSDGYEAPTTQYVPENPRGPKPAVETIATTGVPAEATENQPTAPVETPEPDQAAAVSAPAPVQPAATPASDANPFD